MARRGHGDGSIYRRKDGRWAASISLEGRKRKTFYGKTRKEVQEQLNKALYEQKQGMLMVGPQQTVAEYLKYWLGNITRKLVANNPQKSCEPPTGEGLSPSGMGTQHAKIVSWKNEADEKERRLLRWALQAEARHWLPNERVASCLRHVLPISLGVEVFHDPQHQVAHYGGLMQCGSVWHCPNCAAKISERRRSEDLEPAITYHIAHNGAVYMETYTVSHTCFDSLPDLLQRFLKARERKRQERQVCKSKQAFGVVGTIPVLEVTWSKLNAWHPHKHELVFTATQESDGEVSRYEAQARATWKRVALQFGLHMDDHAYQLDRTYGAVADYIAKYGREPIKLQWGVEAEMTKGHLKQGRGRKEEHVTPFGLLSHIYLGEEELVSAFQEYARCFKGRKQLTWSKGLRKRLLGNEQEKTDEELAREQHEDAVLLGRLTLAQWRVVLANDALGELLEVARSGEWELVVSFLAELGCEFAQSELKNKEQTS